MTQKAPVRILFTGYAPVHFICFRPLFERLMSRIDVDVYLSGGVRTREGDDYLYDTDALYRPFGLPEDRLLSVEAIREQDFDVLFSAHTKLIEPGSVHRRIQIFHGISFRNKSVRPANMNCDYYFLIGPYQHRKFLESGLMAEDDPRAVQVGFMKTDGLLDGLFNRQKALARYGFSGDRPVLLYAPTGAKNNSLESMGEAVIERIVQSGKYDLILKLHDHAKRAIDWEERLAHLKGPHFHMERAGDIIPLMKVSDALISDASSVSNEYALLNRPLVFLDTPKLLKKAGEAEHSAMDLDTWGRRGGPLVEKPDQVVTCIDQALAHPELYEQIRTDMATDFFYNPGHAADTAMAWVEKHLLSTAAVA